jgi:hypothetical protein
MATLMAVQVASLSIPPIQFTLHSVPLLWLLTLRLQYDDYDIGIMIFSPVLCYL